MMLRQLALLFCLTLTFPAPAQSDPSEIFAFPLVAGDQAFADLGTKMQHTTVLRADFVQHKKIKALRRPLQSSGAFLFAAQKGIWWHTTQPFQTTFTITPKGIMQQDEGGEPRVIEAARQPMIAGFTEVFMQLFGGDTSALQDRFRIFFKADEEHWRLGLKPKGKIMGHVIEAIVLSGSEHMERVWFLETSGDLTEIHFSGQATQPVELSEQEQARFAF